MLAICLPRIPAGLNMDKLLGRTPQLDADAGEAPQAREQGFNNLLEQVGLDDNWVARIVYTG